MSDKEYIAALLYEREGYEHRLETAEEEGNDEMATEQKGNIAAIDKELKRVGHEAKAPAKRAETRPARSGTTRKRA